MLKELWGFVGLTGYYHKFVANYAQLTKLLTNKLKKDLFLWNLNATVAFNEFNSAITRAPVLSMPNFFHLFVIETNASRPSLGELCYSKQIIK